MSEHTDRAEEGGRGCGTCRGYGLWALGDPVPMWRMDAEDGMPSIACPECGANPNPWPDDDSPDGPA